ncbi:hypothetical protein C4544_01535 [candidate division WS5 bacterium]|uniref:Uncharacterized protein n=1 Tax=candidate division WS5 bacterium TaxID=2093353 RepID=A0A419DFG1_9BACT|nr:MAG: hypothetical protein C4544_01535 [candidate division WS5 bacterium]
MRAGLASMIIEIEGVEDEGDHNAMIIRALEELEELDYDDFKYVLGDLRERCDWGWAVIETPEIIEKLISISSRMFKGENNPEACKLRQWLATCEYITGLKEQAGR